MVGCDVVHSVSGAELIGSADLMIDLAQQVGAVYRIRIRAGTDRRTGIPDCGESCVDERDVLRKDGDESRLIEQPLLEIREVKRPAVHDRTTHAAAVLLLMH